MANTKKYELPITDEKLLRLKQSLSVGTPITVALSFAGISYASYIYMVKIASVVEYVRELEIIKNEDAFIKSGVSMKEIKEEIESNFELNKKTAINKLVEPSGDMITRYKTSKPFRNYADQVYKVISELNTLRAEIVVYHLDAIKKAAHQRGMMASSSQWFLERTQPDFFGKNQTYNNESTAPVPVKVQFVDPNSKENKDRLKQMEDVVLSQLGESNKA